jgi:hypothetical protein
LARCDIDAQLAAIQNPAGPARAEPAKDPAGGRDDDTHTPALTCASLHYEGPSDSCAACGRRGKIGPPCLFTGPLALARSTWRLRETLGVPAAATALALRDGLVLAACTCCRRLATATKWCACLQRCYRARCCCLSAPWVCDAQPLPPPLPLEAIPASRTVASVHLLTSWLQSHTELDRVKFEHDSQQFLVGIAPYCHPTALRTHCLCLSICASFSAASESLRSWLYRGEEEAAGGHLRSAVRGAGAAGSDACCAAAPDC